MRHRRYVCGETSKNGGQRTLVGVAQWTPRAQMLCLTCLPTLDCDGGRAEPDLGCRIRAPGAMRGSEGLCFDSYPAFTYDFPSMADVELHLDGMTAAELLAVSSHVASELEGNLHFHTPSPPLSELRGLMGALEDAQEEYRQLRLRLNEMKAARDVVMQTLKTALKAEADYVVKTSGGDEAKIESAGLHPATQGFRMPSERVSQVMELSSSAGDEPNEVDLTWDKVRCAIGYEVEICRESEELEWGACTTAVQSSATIWGLESGVRHWFRVRATGKTGPGAWSDTVTKYVV